MPRILVVDDNRNARESVRFVLADLAAVGTASLGDDLLTQLARDPAELLVLGLSAPLEQPLRVLREVLLADPNVRILVLADRELLPAAERIFNYRIEAILAQPFDPDELRRRVQDILAAHRRLPTLRESLEEGAAEAPHRGYDLSLLLPHALHPFFARIAASTAHVLIEGERGTGKAALAHRLHRESPWRDAPYAQIHGATATEARIITTLEELAGNGPPRERVATLCIEEIGLAPPEVHSVLRDLAEENFPPGTPARIARMAFRLITTTTEPLADLASRGAISRELRDALSVLRLRIPPLRHRQADLDEICAFMAEDGARRYARPVPRFSEAALERLRTYLWPGNLREFRTVVGRALALTEGDEVAGEAIVFVEAALPTAGTALAPAPREDIPGEPPRSPMEAGAPPSETVAPETITPMPETPVPTGEPSARPLELVAQLLAHEVKNPLVAIKTFTQLLKDKFDDQEFRDRFYEIVSGDVERIDSLVEVASAFSRLGEPHPGPVDVSGLLDHALKQFELAFLNKRIVVLRESTGAARPARADKEQLNFAVGAIISKVVDVMPEGSDLQISTSTAPGSDDAPGQRLLTSLRFVAAEGLLAELPILAGEQEAPPGSLEVALARDVITRQGGALRLQTANEDTTILTIDLPAE